MAIGEEERLDRAARTAAEQHWQHVRERVERFNDVLESDVEASSPIAAETVIRGLESLERIYVAADSEHREHLLPTILNLSRWLTMAVTICVEAPDP